MPPRQVFDYRTLGSVDCGGSGDETGITSGMRLISCSAKTNKTI
jgi:hypothetical protein